MELYDVFKKLPDTAIVTDSFGYVLDFNRKDPFPQMRKGRQIRQYIPERPADHGMEVHIRSGWYYLRVTPIQEASARVGYIYYLVDITKIRAMIHENQEKQEDLARLTQDKIRLHEELTSYARQAEALADYNQRLEIAREIHDKDGHAITVLHTISQMCLKLVGRDMRQYASLLTQGETICEEQRRNLKQRFDSITEGLYHFCASGIFKVELSIEGTEPVSAASYVNLILDICEEAYHNTLNHSLATAFFIELTFDEGAIRLSLCDNGKCRGSFTPGFGLTVMQERVRARGGSIDFYMEENRGFMIKIYFGLED